MAGKAHLNGDEDSLERILVAPVPKNAKAIGREVHGFDDKVWKVNARAIVTEGNVHKFSQHAEPRNILLSTGDSVLVEAAPSDQILASAWARTIRRLAILSSGAVRICWGLR